LDGAIATALTSDSSLPDRNFPRNNAGPFAAQFLRLNLQNIRYVRRTMILEEQSIHGFIRELQFLLRRDQRLAFYSFFVPAHLMLQKKWGRETVKVNLTQLSSYICASFDAGECRKNGAKTRLLSRFSSFLASGMAPRQGRQ